MENSPSDSRKRAHSPTPLSNSPPHKIAGLKMVDLSLTDTQHQEMDHLILTQLEPLLSYAPPEQKLPSILGQIVVCSNGLLDNTYAKHDEGQRLLDSDRRIVQELQDAWDEKSFARIRRLDILQSKVAATDSSPKKTPPTQRAARLDPEFQTITFAWQGSYRGSMHRLLYNNINNMIRTAPYSNSVSIVQSSGTGKSRMVHEQSNLVFTVPFNLREESDNRDLSYPFPDSNVRVHLAKHIPSDNVDNVKAYYLVFLRHLFEEVLRELVALYTQKDTAASYEALATSWNVHLQGGARSTLYKTVIEGANKNWQNFEETVKEYQNQHAEFDLSHEVDPVSLRAASHMATQKLDDLLTTIDRYISHKEVQKAKRQSPEPVKLVIYFDEAHVLAADTKPLTTNPDDKYLYDILCSCFNYFLGRSIFFIFLSTNTSIDVFAPSSSLARSARMRDNIDTLQAPITEVPFDCAPESPVQPYCHKLDHVQGIIARGNCLKILSNYSHTELTPAARLAVVDVRLMLDYEPRRRHSINRAYLRSGYPSEPIVSEAAAQQLHSFRQRAPFPLMDILKENIQSGLLDRGQRGELVARALVMSAYDRAVEVDHPSPTKGKPPLYSKGCSVITFIKELFSEAYANEILNSVPDNVRGGVKLKDAFKNARIRFTHFVKMVDDTSTSTAAMFAAFVRGFATVCHNEQTEVDLMLPILLWDEKLCEEVMSAIMIQVKRRAKAGTLVAYEIEESNIAFFPPQSGTNERASTRPYIALIMELGVRAEISPEVKTTVKVREQPKNAKKKKTTNTPSGSSRENVRSSVKEEKRDISPSEVYIVQPGRNKYPRSNHPRYSIFAYGCSSTVYKIVEVSQKGDYAFLLASGDFPTEHPRTSSESLQAVRRMKPFWSAGSCCYHWIENDFLNQSENNESTEESWLVVGSPLQDHDDEIMDES
ncbi:hypothetical protein K439DRAFT_1625165 [Ramaria rubella]|nr:hypothetical protein K439DRAFT_1625165 [Ramaria rubella]